MEGRTDGRSHSVRVSESVPTRRAPEAWLPPPHTHTGQKRTAIRPRALTGARTPEVADRKDVKERRTAAKAAVKKTLKTTHRREGRR